MAVTVGQAKQQLSQVEAALSNQSALHDNVISNFKKLDENKNGFLDGSETKKLIQDLCQIMNLPPPNEEAFSQHMKLIDQNQDQKLEEKEVELAVQGAISFKRDSLKHFLSFAERDKLGDEAPLPSC